MARILAIDYGTKRCGMAISDPLAIIANGLDTVTSDELMPTLERIHAHQGFETIVIGLPLRMSGELSGVEARILELIPKLERRFPEVRIERFDERFTSKLAAQAMIAAGAKKKDRQKKENIDKVSASLILQEYLNTKA